MAPKRMRLRLRRFLARRRSLRNRIIAWSTIPTALVLVIAAWATLSAFQNLTEDLVIERDRELTRLIAGELARELTQDAELVSLLARSPQMSSAQIQSFVLEQVGIIVKPRIGDGGTVYVVDGNGRIIYHWDTNYIGQSPSDQPVVRRVLAGETGALRTRGLDGREIAASYAPVPGTDWGLITEEDWSELIGSSQRYRQPLLLLLILSAVAPILVITLGARRITRPIRDLIKATQNVASGNFDQTITASTSDELAELAQQFNRMTAHIQDSYAALERKVADRTGELATLNAIAATLNESPDLDKTLHRALDALLELLDLEVGEIRVLDAAGDRLVIRAQRGFSARFLQSTDRRPMAETLPGQVLQQGQLAVFNALRRRPDALPALREGLTALIICPVMVESTRLGTLCLATRRGERLFSTNERDLLRAVSDQLGMAIDKARLFEMEQRRAEQFQLISQVGQRITSILAIDDLLQEIVHLVRQRLGYFVVGIGLLEEDEIIIKAIAGPTPESGAFEPVRLALDETAIVSQVAQTGEAILASDIPEQLNLYGLPNADPTRSELAVPLKTKDAVIGVLDAQSDRRDGFDEKDLTVLQALAHQAAIAIENARLYQKAQELAVIEERNRLARDLHDSVTQSLYGVTLFGEAAGRLMVSGNMQLAADHLQELQSTAQEALREMRLLIFELRPPNLEEEGLRGALRARLDAVEGRIGLETTLQVVGPDRRLSPEIEQGLYRIAQEALNNALKHSQAHHISVRLQQDQPAVVLEISDDGVGFDPSTEARRGGLGLQGMHERAVQMGSRLRIHSRPGKGTQVRVEIPQ